jgi:hypothetical protein
MPTTAKPSTNGTATPCNQPQPAATPGAPGPATPVADGSNGTVPKPATDGRGADGKFATGNKAGRGNPHARRMAALRQAFLSAATEERLKELGEKLYAAAVGGDWIAAKLYLTYVVGRPVDVVDPDRLDLDEWRRLNSNPTAAEVYAAKADLMTAAGAIQFVAGYLDGGDVTTFVNRLLEMTAADEDDEDEVYTRAAWSMARRIEAAREDRRKRRASS